MEEIRKAIDKMTTFDELDEVHKMYNARWSQLRQEQVRKFSKGDRVAWTHKYQSFKGTVITINEKTLSVKADGGGKWRIGPSSLIKIEETEKEKKVAADYDKAHDELVNQ